jgi:peptidoglycan/LPS O-acetylase OafA/YrhL
MSVSEANAAAPESPATVAQPTRPALAGVVHPGVRGKGHVPELDGLRALAVMLVFLDHFAPTATLPHVRILHQIGWIGVDVFFVLSGLLITGILLDARQHAHFYRTFYVRRALRIFPLYYALLLVVVAVMLARRGSEPYREMLETWGSPGWFFAYLGNIKTAISGAEPPAAFVPMWSLHVEEQFYLLFPLLIHRLRVLTLRRLLVGVIIAAPVIRFGLWLVAPDKPLVAYMLLPCRMDGLAFGALIALRLRMPRPWPLGKPDLAVAATILSLAACGLFWASGRAFDAELERTLGYSFFSAAAAAWIFWIMLYRGTRWTSWLNVRPLQYLGKISYGLYLLQMPAAVLLLWLLSPLHLRPDWLHTVGGWLALAIFCVGLASASWFLLERPLLRLKDKLAPGAMPRPRRVTPRDAA